MQKTIYKRKIVDKINNFLDSKEIIVLHGARQVGKTSIIYYFIQKLEKQYNKNNIFYFDLEISRFLKLMNSGYEELYNYLIASGWKKNQKAFVFIDEIQYLNDPSKFLKLCHDHLGNKIKFIISGSSTFEIKKKFKNSLVGRIVDFEVWPLDFEEFLLFKNKNYNLTLKNLPQIIHDELKKLYQEYAIYGGYPQIVLENNISKKEIYLSQIINTYIKKDIRDLADIRNIDKFNKLLEVLASQSGNLLNILELSNTINLSRQTVEEYLFLLENTYIIKLVKPFSKNKRSELFRTPKIYFIDHGLVNLLNFQTFPKVLSGNIFETAIFSDLLKQYGKSSIYFWRTMAKQEVDFIINKKTKIIPIEVKLNINSFKSANLKYFFDLYKIKTGYAIFLKGERDCEKQNKIQYIYPWEIVNL
ncbi:MAG: ATP-binding protein [Patescibacteria group bacterium]|nr:ATP-binding protein [Patescibacteria group bacterium]MBU1160329.1 ATP-binding protein [Patescibacteria group bacterium]MBU1350200.1 ATP-binding protein [Patescibacteria group bacterium]MBU1421445.1 ATP-binding protein [Patescibacteria group bacterium]MBU1778710.1 ATP-binding protein [Patescibacteria group bacterium]